MMTCQILEASAVVLFLTFVQSALSFHESTINVAWLVSEDTQHEVSISSSIGALALAVSKATNMTGDSFNITWADPSCSKKASVIALYQVLIEKRFSPDLILGPQCSNAMIYVGQLASFRNLPAFGWVSEGYQLRPDWYTYNTLVRVYPPMNSIGKGLTMLLEWFHWRLVSVISSDSSVNSESRYNELGEVLIKYLTDDFDVVRYVSQVKSPPDDNSIRDIYDTIKKEARILILCVPFDEITAWMRVAYDMGMTKGDFIFILVNAVLPSPSLYKNLTQPGFWQTGTSYDDKLEVAFRNLLILTMRPTDHNLTTKFYEEANRAANASDWVENLEITPEPSDFYAPFLHDAFLLFAQLSGEAHDIGCGRNNGTCISRRAQNRKFMNPELVTGKIILDSMADRVPEFLILDLNRQKQFHMVLNTSVDIINGEIVYEMNSVEEIIWGNGKVGWANRPRDNPECGFDNEKCPNLALYIGLPLGLLVLIALIVAGFMLIRRYQFEQSIKNMAWKINHSDLNMTNGPYGGKNMSASRLSLRGRHRGSLTSLKNSHGATKEADNISVLTSEIDQIFISTAKYRNNTVAVKSFTKPRLTFDRKLMVEMTTMTNLKHNNLAAFIGASSAPPELFEVWEYCSKGSLQDIIWNDAINLDNMFKFSIVIDILTGLKYLHDSHLKMHGRLKSSNVVVDGRWMCKLTDYGLFNFREGQQQPDLEATEQKIYSQQFWMAPELLKELNDGRKLSTSSVLTKGAKKQQILPMSQEGDVYASAIIVKEVMTRTGPYTEYDYLSPKEIVARVRENGVKDEPFRPKVTDLSDPQLSKVAAVVKSGWSEKPAERPTAQQMLRELQRINPFKSANVIDNMIRMMERYSNNLEELVSERTQQVEEEKKKSDTLLFRMLPRPVAEKLKFGEQVEAESFDAVTIYFSDIVKFTNLSAESTPLQVVALLNGLYTLFDGTCSHHDVYKVETIGDAYMLVSGLPVKNGNRHAAEIANCALELLSGVLNFKVPHKPDYKLQLRIGLHTGPAVSGIVGLTMPRYCLFGSTVAHASLMESGGLPMRIHLSEVTYQLLSRFPGYHLALRGSVVDMKGIGVIKSYWLCGRDNFSGPLPSFDELASEDSPPPKRLPVTVASDRESDHISTEGNKPSGTEVANATIHENDKSRQTKDNKVKPIAEVLPNKLQVLSKDRVRPVAEVLPNLVKQDLRDNGSTSASTKSVNLPRPSSANILESSFTTTSLADGDNSENLLKKPEPIVLHPETFDPKKSHSDAKPVSAWMEENTADKDTKGSELTAAGQSGRPKNSQPVEKLTAHSTASKSEQFPRSTVSHTPNRESKVTNNSTTEVKFNLKDFGLNLPKAEDMSPTCTTEFKFNLGDFRQSENKTARRQENDGVQTQKAQLNPGKNAERKRTKDKKHTQKLPNKSKITPIHFHSQNRVGVEKDEFANDNAAFITDSEDETGDNPRTVPSQGPQLVHRNATLKTAWTIDEDGSDKFTDDDNDPNLHN